MGSFVEFKLLRAVIKGLFCEGYFVSVSDQGRLEWFNNSNLHNKILQAESNSTFSLSIYVLTPNPTQQAGYRDRQYILEWYDFIGARSGQSISRTVVLLGQRFMVGTMLRILFFVVFYLFFFYFFMYIHFVMSFAFLQCFEIFFIFCS